MASARIQDSFHPAAFGEASNSAEGFFNASAMVGAATGALAGATLLGGRFEYAAVLFGTLGVVLGSFLFGAVARMLMPAWTAIRTRHHD